MREGLGGEGAWRRGRFKEEPYFGNGRPGEGALEEGGDTGLGTPELDPECPRDDV